MLRVPEARVEGWPADPVERLMLLYPLLRRTARSLTSPPEEVEDLVQEALVRTLIRHPDLASLERPLGYTRTVMMRVVFARRRFTSREVPLETQDRLETLPHDLDAGPIVESALRELAPKQRACMALHFLYGMTDAEIAPALGCTRSTVRSQLARGLATLRDHMRETDDADD